jgi:predicted TIM-barrel fold metal-dependent hydrolase
MKAKMFEVVLHLLPSGKSPVTALEEQINEFLSKHPNLKLVTTHMSTQQGRVLHYCFLHPVL